MYVMLACYLPKKYMIFRKQVNIIIVWETVVIAWEKKWRSVITDEVSGWVYFCVGATTLISVRFFSSGGISCSCLVFTTTLRLKSAVCDCMNVRHNYFVVTLNFTVTVVVSNVSLCVVVFVCLCPTQTYGVLYNSRWFFTIHNTDIWLAWPVFIAGNLR